MVLIAGYRQDLLPRRLYRDVIQMFRELMEGSLPRDLENVN